MKTLYLTNKWHLLAASSGSEGSELAVMDLILIPFQRVLLSYTLPSWLGCFTKAWSSNATALVMRISA